MRYESTQYGRIINGLFSAAILLMTVAYLLDWGTRPLPLVPYLVLTGVLLLILLLFYKLTVRVEDAVVHVIYGIGLIHLRLPRRQIMGLRCVTNPGYYGLGIRIIPGGMLYNIEGRNAVEIRYDQEGKDIVRIGCKDCTELLRAIQAQCMP